MFKCFVSKEIKQVSQIVWAHKVMEFGNTVPDTSRVLVSGMDTRLRSYIYRFYALVVMDMSYCRPSFSDIMSVRRNGGSALGFPHVEYYMHDMCEWKRQSSESSLARPSSWFQCTGEL
jgi:hypothetical protein